ncbi:recombinase family protein [Alkaliphilus peptidifermentans]|uniref:Site-specific DNA recombinase n=1 Tax=Alkaliphilus peptidifermentans DSM 18978 TaxID=1120976 RepID=A0A1G5EEC6_9FIRM|nr:recombinase family protein [Alkaliphilus peptidifermentans]SCY24808.1 Site-specific DNA recombinase [Alkaliphilus peptidifermentans DSM 18978]
MRVRIIEPIRKVQDVKKKVCAYARVSTDSEAQGDSLENQTTYYENLIISNPEYEFVGVFADKGITGTTENRPGFKRMIKAARDGQIDLIITKSISRLARNTTVMLEVVRELKELGVEVRYEKENINTLSGDGELMLAVLSSFAQEESKNVSDNIKWRVRKKFEAGEVMINTTRFLGYDKSKDGNLIINEEEANIVKRIFNEYLGGKGTFLIGKELNHEKVPTVTGGQWYDSTILTILKNEKYKGDVLLQKTYTLDHLTKKKVKNTGEVNSYYIENNHPAIISKEMWERVQEEIKRRGKCKGNTGGRDKYTKQYPLSRMLYCSKCGASLIRRTWNSKLSCRKIVWQCSNYIKNGKNSCEGTKIEDEIISRINIKEEVIVKEEMKNGEKYYSYTSKGKQNKSRREFKTTESENGSLLQGFHRPIRTVIKL